MGRAHQLTDFQVEVARVFFTLETAKGYLVAGGAALVASDLISRPTEDLDLFTAAPTTSVAPARDAYVRALQSHGCDVVMVHDGPTFCRMIVSRAKDQTLVDLAIDAPPHSRPTVTELGPTVSPSELAGRKLLALFDRAEARDFADVYVLAKRFGKETLIAQATMIDAGFDLGVLAQMMTTMQRFDAQEIPLGEDDLAMARRFFADWARELG